jgi:hypothetical protein
MRRSPSVTSHKIRQPPRGKRLRVAFGEPRRRSDRRPITMFPISGSRPDQLHPRRPWPMATVSPSPWHQPSEPNSAHTVPQADHVTDFRIAGHIFASTRRDAPDLARSRGSSCSTPVRPMRQQRKAPEDGGPNCFCCDRLCAAATHCPIDARALPGRSTGSIAIGLPRRRRVKGCPFASATNRTGR